MIRDNRPPVSVVIPTYNSEETLSTCLKSVSEQSYPNNGEYVLLLDSDQILNHTAITRALEMCKKYDMLCLEEHSYKPKTWVEWLFETDRCLVHNLANIHLDPLEGTLLARFYKRRDLEEAFDAIPKEKILTVAVYDHAIIDYEAYNISQKVGILPNALWHIELASLIELWKKNYRYGKPR
jgi:cellulose synthase/poly-beta-1,6-N-acetylglucosamine synthase-like glycosyltransferase